MSKWSTVQFFTIKTPLRKEFIHQRPEIIIVYALQLMNHFMNNDIFQAFSGGFFASSRFNQMRRSLMLHAPHLVFIFLTPH